MRGLTKLVLSLAGILSGLMIFGFLLFANLTTRAQIPTSSNAEGIVVLTGGTQRIRAAGKLLDQRHARRLLISGVNRRVSRAKLRRLLNIDQATFDCCVDIDYIAQNTRGNAIETRKWAKRHAFASLIVVTSSYHMPRTLTELGHLLPALDLIAYPVVPDRFRGSLWWLNREDLLLLSAEYLKYLPSAARFSVGRLMGSPPKSGGNKHAPHKAVAIQ